ncbi:FMN-binding protein [Humibacillus xanthopallidus]|uniref:FMN-binding protein n=1 Tax=Humibacillus xanthopallidus TaxID=412689 RepID=A0A543I1U5_9MICO|nr:FMN-binding protein [Humibacillus xanthopallidus]TQM64569.1 FMN-binding protein [Humibacillus xanthopallidus]
MRKTTSVIVGVASAVALGASWAAGLTPAKPALSGVHLVAAAPPTSAGTPSAKASSSQASAAPPNKSSRTSSGGRSATPTPTQKKSAPAPAPAPTSGTVLGGAADTPFGTVQVKVSYTGTKITNVRAVQLTDSSQHSVSISAYAAPILRQEALAAQSAQIDVVSGATYTSEGYIQSLQSAIDAAHLG